MGKRRRVTGISFRSAPRAMDEKAVPIPLAIRQFVAGFFDGDGSVYVPPPTKLRPTQTVRVRFRQSYNSGIPPELEYVKLHYGGRIHETRKAQGHQRTSWVLDIGEQNWGTGILRDMEAHAVKKASQAAIALEYLTAGKMRTEFFSQSLKDAKKAAANVAIDVSRLTDAYVAGLFAADGSVASIPAKVSGGERYHYFTSSISQVSCPRLVDAIKDAVRFGQTYGGILQFNREETLQFFQKIQPHLIGQKSSQVAIVAEFHPRMHPGRKRDASEIEEAREIAKKLKIMK